MVKCNICGNEYNSLGVHLRRSHNVTVSEYQILYPGAKVQSDESRLSRSEGAKKKWKNPEYRDSMIQRLNSYSNSEANKSRLRAQNKDPEFIDSQRERLSKLATDTNKKQWSLNYEECRKRATKNVLWGAKVSSVTCIQRDVARYLETIGIRYSLEKYFTFGEKLVRVDLYLDDLDLVVEVNGNYWHGRPGTPLEEMSNFQREGYERDEFKRSVFGDRVLFLWEDDILSGKYKETLDEFITIGHVKQGELLEP